MRRLSYLTLAAFCGFSAPLIHETSLAAELKPQTLLPNTPVYVAADPFLISVTLQTNGTLFITPSWAGLSATPAYDLLQQPPTIRATSINGWLTGEVALSNGTWAPGSRQPILLARRAV